MGVLLMYSTNGKKTGEKDQDQAVPACPPNIYRLVLNNHSVDMDNTLSILHSNLVEKGFNVIKVPNCMSLLQENMHMNIPLTLHTQADNHDREIQYSIACAKLMIACEDSYIRAAAAHGYRGNKTVIITDNYLMILKEIKSDLYNQVIEKIGMTHTKFMRRYDLVVDEETTAVISPSGSVGNNTSLIHNTHSSMRQNKIRKNKDQECAEIIMTYIKERFEYLKMM